MPLQHLRSSTAHKRPVPGNMSDGQLGINTNTGSPGLFFKDSNNALVKVGPVHVGTTAPNASPASGGTAGNSVGEQWLDTSGANPVLKIWDGSAWQSQSGEYVNASGDVMTGALGIIAGSASAPGLYFSGDTNTGLYSPSADQLALATGGSERLRFTSAGLIGIGTSSPGYALDTVAGSGSAVVARFRGNSGANNNTQIRFYGNNAATDQWAIGGSVATGDTGRDFHIYDLVANANRFAIDSSGRVGVGTTSPGGPIEIQGSQFAYFRNNCAGQSPAGSIALGMVALGTNVQSSDGGAALVYGIPYGASGFDIASWDGTNYVRRFRIDNSGRVGVGTSTPAVACDVVGQVRASTGILFGSDTAAANALNDYEEGTFTPTIVGTSSAGTGTYGANGQQGRYTKIGNRVFFDLYLAWSAHTGTGDLQITGLPFTVQNTTNLNRTFSAIFSNVALTAGSIGAAFSAPNTTTILLRQMPTGGGAVATVPMDTSAQISISGSFDV